MTAGRRTTWSAWTSPDVRWPSWYGRCGRFSRAPGSDFADGHVPPLPQFRFVNIDREQWWDFTGGSEFGLIDVSKVPDDAIAALRRVLLPRADSPTAWLDGRRVLVVDEVKNTGDTLQIARALLPTRLPDR